MTGDIGEREILGTEKLDRRAFEELIVFFADVSCVFNRLVTYIVYVLGSAGSRRGPGGIEAGLDCGIDTHGTCADYSDIVWVRLQSVESDIWG